MTGVLPRSRRSVRPGDRERHPAREAPAGPTAADLAREVRDVVADLPRFLTAPLVRPWRLRWGATAAEVAAAMPGDDLVARARYRCTRAITIAAPPAEVWPWLVQVGCRRAGWYADDLLDHLGHPSAREVVPELQDVRVGTWLPMAPTPSEGTAFVVSSLDAPREMLWRTPTSTWAWRLVPLGGDRTRLVTRLRARFDLRHPAGLLGVLLLELGDFPMMRRMLRGIRERAETEHRRRVPPAVHPRRLAAIRTVHTAAWASIESCVGYLLWSGMTGRSDRRAAAAAAVVVGAGAWSSPRTASAVRSPGSPRPPGPPVARSPTSTSRAGSRGTCRPSTSRCWG
ncbi:hypothetical protein [Geodermatophilus sp. FMUSA9-8]|uniref:hypothetical protein n=1 Tax=Geodermatophilus sp. FMUSA9-8 TaxID=3120155 RepID=UPI0030087632